MKPIKTATALANNNNNLAKVTPQRSQKTLGWYMSEELLEKTGGAQSPSLLREEARRKRRGGRRGRKLTESLSTASEGSETTTENEPKPLVETPAVPLVAAKEDFCFYDPATDGYYYEQSGAKGWRRRNPYEEVPHPTQKAKQEEVAVPMFSAPLTIQQKLMVQQIVAARNCQPQPMKYYDPNSDGFYYEMASVDGWRRRQPNLSASTSSYSRPAMQPIPQSYGAALARGEMPAKFVDSSASSSTSDELLGGFPLSRPSSLSFTNNEEEENNVSSALYHFNADKFIEDLIVSQFDRKSGTIDVASPHTPACSRWARKWSLASYNETSKADELAAAAAMAEDDETYQLQKELDNIWKTTA